MGDSLAESLWSARLDGGLVPGGLDGAPTSEGDAYAVQTAQIALARSAQIGWKLGATSQQSLDLLGIDAPFIGPLFKQFRFDSGDEVPIHPAHGPGLETEFTVILADDLPARKEPYDRAEIDAAVGAVCPSFEIVGFRMEGGPIGAGPMLIAAA